MARWPKPRHPGDSIRLANGDLDVVMGTILGRDARNGRIDYLDQVVLHDLGNTPVDIVSDLDVVEAAAAPTVNAYKTNAELAAAFDEMLDTLGGGIGAQLVADARELGYSLYVVGGPVRDLVLGNRKVNDLDMTGDMPAGLFRDLLYHSAIKRLPTERRDLRDAWLPRANISASGVVHCYRIVRASPAQQRDGIQFAIEKFIEYAAFKDHKVGGGRDDFVYGWNPEVDVVWRDLTVNSLLYDPHPQRQVVIDPAGALDDFGVTPGHLRKWSGEVVDHTRITLRPLDIPPGASPMWAAKAVGRTVKSAHKYPTADLSTVVHWVEANQTALQDAADRGDIERAVGFGSHIVKALSPLVDEDLFNAVRPIVVRFKDAGAPQWFVQAVMRDIPAGGSFRGGDGGGTGRTGTVSGSGWSPAAVSAALLVSQGHEYAIGEDLPNPADGDPTAAPAYFSSQVQGWQLVNVPVAGVGQVWVHTDGDRLVCGVDEQGRVVSAVPPDASP